MNNSSKSPDANNFNGLVNDYDKRAYVFQQVVKKHNQHIKDMRKSFAIREKSKDKEDTELVMVKKLCLQPNPVKTSIRDKRTSYGFKLPINEQGTQISNLQS